VVVYQKKNFQVYTGNGGYIIHNTNYEFSEAHTHYIQSRSMAKVIIRNVLYKRKPHTKNRYLLKSHQRLSKDQTYIDMIETLIQKSKDKQSYKNVPSGVRR